MNTKNITNLLKAYFIESWKTDLFQFGILVAIILFGTLANGASMHFAIFCATIFLMIYPERLFRNLHSNSPKIHYLSIPASNSEKVVANMLLANIYYVAGLALSCVIGLGLAHLYLTMRGFDGVSLQTSINGNGILLMYGMLAVFFFGSVYFRKKTTLSTIGVSMLIGLIFTTLFSLVLWVNGIILIPKDAVFGDYRWSFNYPEDISERFLNALFYLFLAGEIIYFYALSFLRLKETEA